MSVPECVGEGSLRIVHVLRSPMGGLFRHVVDLAEAQMARGHMVGLIADSSTGGQQADDVLAALVPRLALGLVRMPMRRDPHALDIVALARVGRALRQSRPDIVHGHGAKGALYARLPGATPFGRRRPSRIYTPHGGSLHYDPRSLKGGLILRMERWLARRTDVILFESHYAAERFRDAVGEPPCPVKIVHNGLRANEFAAVSPHRDAADFLFIGELRLLKGVDLLLEALAALSRSMGRPLRAALVGSGPDRERFEAMTQSLGLAGSVEFRGPMAARDAFALGRILVVPSRAESLPYIVLEAAAAQVPMIATRVGGIPEIFGGAAGSLVAADDAGALAAAMAAQLALSAEQRRAAAVALSRFIETRFAVGRMADDVIGSYREALAAGDAAPAARAKPAAARLPRYGL